LLIGDVELKKELARKGRERVLNNFTQKKVARETYRVWEKGTGYFK